MTEDQYAFTEGEGVYMLTTLRDNRWGTIEERTLSTGRVSIPRYYIRGSWYYEDELERVLYSVLVANIGWVRTAERSYDEAKKMYDYYVDRDALQVTLWKTRVNDPIEEYAGEGAL
jgi:hypothetical protein